MFAKDALKGLAYVKVSRVPDLTPSRGADYACALDVSFVAR